MVTWNNEDLINTLDEFYDIYQERPIQDNFGGMNSIHMFYTWFLLKRLNPPFIIESGIWKGQSSWLIERACPKSTIISIDPALHLRTYISQKIYYTTIDFANLDFSKSNIDVPNTVCFFDDHYGSDRLFQAKKHGFKHLIFEDNYHDDRGNTNHPTGQASSPKSLLQKKTQEAQNAHDIIDIYYEFPPITPNHTEYRDHAHFDLTKEEYDKMTKPPLLATPRNITDELYFSEAHGYTWLCYILLK